MRTDTSQSSDAAPYGRPAPTATEIHSLLAARWSPRSLDPDAPVTVEEVAGVLEAARWAPSRSNAQPWRFVVADDRAPQARDRLRASLRPGNAWAKAAPVLVLTLAVRDFPPRDDKPAKVNAHAWHDVGAATLALMLEATARGIAAHPMAGFDAAEAADAVGLPDELDVVALLAVGRPLADPADADPDVTARDGRPRERRPIEELAWLGVVGGPPLGDERAERPHT